jgi:hypothetical protein
MQRNQLFLEDRTNEENKNFLKGLYDNNGLVATIKWFDILDGSSIRRHLDKDMTLDAFLKLMNGDYLIRLQIGSPTPDEIRYLADVRYERTNRFAWLECPLTKHNYNVVARLFKKTFGQNMESVEVSDHLKAYNKSLGPLPF